MKKNKLKKIAFIVAIILIGCLCAFANSLVGNPISKFIVTNSVENYINENYANTDYEIGKVIYSFKDGNYHVNVNSPSSKDSYFSISMNMFGTLKLDTYRAYVVHRENTARRLDDEYRKLTDKVFDSSSFPYVCDIAYGTIEFIPQEYANNTDVPSYAIIQEELVLDQQYDMNVLGKQAGHLVVYVNDESITIEKASEIMIGIKQEMDEAGISFYSIDFVLRRPKPEEGPWDEEEIRVNEYLSSDIYEEGMVDRLKDAVEATKAYYEMLDKENEKYVEKKE